MKCCIACGMPMIHIADYPLFDLSKRYCKHCAHPDGTMLSFAECQQRLIQNLITKYKQEPVIAKTNATKILRKLPAWKPLR